MTSEMFAKRLEAMEKVLDERASNLAEATKEEQALARDERTLGYAVAQSAVDHIINLIRAARASLLDDKCQFRKEGNPDAPPCGASALTVVGKLSLCQEHLIGICHQAGVQAAIDEVRKYGLSLASLYKMVSPDHATYASGRARVEAIAGLTVALQKRFGHGKRITQN